MRFIFNRMKRIRAFVLLTSIVTGVVLSAEGTPVKIFYAPAQLQDASEAREADLSVKHQAELSRTLFQQAT